MIFTIWPSFQSSGIASSSHTLSKISYSICVEIFISAFGSSALMPSWHGVFPFCCFRITPAIYFLLGFAMLTSSLEWASGMATGSVGDGRLNNSFKYSPHLFSCFSSLVSLFPGYLWWVLMLSSSFLIASWLGHIDPFSCVALLLSASLASSSKNFLLEGLMNLRNSRLISQYCPSASFLTALVLLLLILYQCLLLVSISFMVSMGINSCVGFVLGQGSL